MKKTIPKFGILCPLCCSPRISYDGDTWNNNRANNTLYWKEFEKQKSITFHCNNHDCQCVFIIRRKVRQAYLFQKKMYERGKR